MRSYSLFLCLCTVFAYVLISPAHAGVPPDEGAIAGTITEPDGSTPIDGILVEVFYWTGFWWNWAGQASTGPGGKYIISALAPNTYRVKFRDFNNGDYIPEIYDNADGDDLNAGADVVVLADTTNTVDASLSAASKISGTVYAPNGITPLELINIGVYRWDGGAWVVVGDGGTSTDDTGYYIHGGLTAGTYRVQFNDFFTGTHAGEFYDDAVDLISASNVVVSENITVTGINASLAIASKIIGTITEPDGLTPIEGVFADLYRWNGSIWDYIDSGITYTDGVYDIVGLAAGVYRIEFIDTYSGLYINEAYHNAVDLANGMDIVLSADMVVSNVDASLSFLGTPEPPKLLGFKPAGANSFNIMFTGMPGGEYILRETFTLDGGWADVGVSQVCVYGTNTISRSSPTVNVFWTIRRLP